MAEDTRAQQAPENETQAEPMPSSDQQTSEQPESSEAAPVQQEPQAQEQTQQQQEVSEPTEGREELSLPEDGVKDRTRDQFEKLKTQLAQERKKRVEMESVFNKIQPSGTGVGNTGTTGLDNNRQQSKPIYDSETGLVDVQALEDLRTRTLQAEQRAQMANQRIMEQEETRQTQEAYGSHPELNPEADNFDEDFYNITKSLLLDSMVSPHNYGGQQLTFKAAADKAKNFINRSSEQAKQAGAKEAISKLSAKEGASLEASGRSDRRQQVAPTEQLREQTREGNISSIADRLRGIPPRE